MNSFDHTLDRAKAHLSIEQLDRLRGSLAALLREQALAYTRGESSSLPEETLRELAASLLYTIQAGPDASPTALRSLACENLQRRYERCLNNLTQRTADARTLLHAFCAHTPHYGSIALRDTLASLITEIDRYDTRFFAHRIPGAIDYPLVRAVPDHVLGIDYVLEYLARLHAEMRLLGRFKMHRVLALLDGYSRSWRKLCLNLCMPVVTNALGLILLNESPQRLHISNSLRSTLLDKLLAMDDAKREAELMHAGVRLCQALSLTEEADLQLVLALCLDLAPRLNEAVAADDLSHIFFSFGVPIRSHNPFQ